MTRYDVETWIAVSVCAVLALAVLGGILFGDYFRGGVGK